MLREGNDPGASIGALQTKANTGRASVKVRVHWKADFLPRRDEPVKGV